MTTGILSGISVWELVALVASLVQLLACSYLGLCAVMTLRKIPSKSTTGDLSALRNGAASWIDLTRFAKRVGTATLLVGISSVTADGALLQMVNERRTAPLITRTNVSVVKVYGPYEYDLKPDAKGWDGHPDWQETMRGVFCEDGPAPGWKQGDVLEKLAYRLHSNPTCWSINGQSATGFKLRR